MNMFQNSIRFTYIIGESLNIYEACNNMVIQRIPEVRSHDLCRISITQNEKLKLKSKKYKSNELGEVEFKMDNDVMILDFISIKAIRSKGKKYPIETKLIIQVNGNSYDSMPFQVKKKFKKITNYKDEVFNKFICQENFDKDLIEKDQNLHKAVSEDSIQFVHEDKKMFVFNCVDFSNNRLKSRNQSKIIFERIKPVFEVKHRYNVEMHLNSTKEDFLTSLYSYSNTLETAKGQCIILIMTHGTNYGFHTKDRFVNLEEFQSGISSILKNDLLVKIFIFAHCREEIEPVQDNDFLNSIKENEDGKSGLVDLNIFREKNKKLNKYISLNNFSEKLIVENSNILMAFSCKPNTISRIGSEGCFYVGTLLNVIEKIPRSDQDLDFDYIFEKTEIKFQKLNLIYDEKPVTQEPSHITSSKR